MKKLILLFIFISVSLSGKSVDLSTVIKVASNFMNKKLPERENTVMEVIPEKFDGETALYLVNFLEGGWVMVSDTRSTVPILGYDLTGKYELDTDKPEALISWINNYKKQIIKVKLLKSENTDTNKKWDELLSDASSGYLKSYNPGKSLLNMTKGTIRWSQSTNNSGGCTPSYNQSCITSSGCNCGKKTSWMWSCCNGANYVVLGMA